MRCYKLGLFLSLILLALPCFGQFGTISYVPLSGYCNTNTLGFDTTNNVVYSCGSPPQNFWKVVTFETVQKGPLSGTCNPNSLGFDSTNNVVYSCGLAPNNTWKILGGAGGGGGFGYSVPSPYPTVQQALTAAQAAGSGPVVVLPSSTDTTSYVNTTNIRVDTYKQDAAGQDSRFFRDVSEWGRIDGKTMTCNAVAGSNSLSCGATFVNSPAPAGDVGKLILVDGAGPQTGQIGGTISVASTVGVTPNPAVAGTWQGVIFNDSGDGCNTIDTMPYAFVTIDSTGMPTGNLHWTQNFYGKGCTRPPTSGTVMNITGTVTFSGGTMVQGDLVSTITAVSGTNTIIIADNPVVTVGGATALYGTDVHDTFQNACNSVSKGSMLVSGTLTFSGIGLTSHGIDCNSAGLKIIGNGYQPVNAVGAGSTLVYAGKTPNTAGANPTAYVLNLAYGWGPMAERIGVRGNTQAMPYGIILSYGTGGGHTAPGSGSGVNQFGKIDQAWIGWEWGDAYGGDPIQPIRLQSCIFSAGPGGNTDFWSFDRIYCYGADVGMDSMNDQATGYKIGKWQSEFGNIGLALVGGIDIDDYYTEFNRVDFTAGSPYWPGAPLILAHFRNYGGESSAMEFESSPPGGQNWNASQIIVDNGGLGGGNGFLNGGSAYNRPDGVTSDYHSINTGGVKWTGPIRGQIILPWDNQGASGSYGGLSFEFSELVNQQIEWYGSGTIAASAGWAGGGYLKIGNSLGPYNTYVVVPLNATDWYPTGNYPLMLNVNRSQTHIGTLNVQAPSWGSGSTAGSGTSLYTIGTAGSTTYNYQLTCVDSLGGETVASPSSPGSSSTIFTLTTGNATLNTTNYNQFSIHQREGCPKFNLYGDGGIGGAIGYLATVTVEQMPGGAYLNDQGKWTKNTSIHPPTTTQSGSVNVGGNLTVAGLTQLNNVNISGICSGTGCGTGGGGSMVYPTAGIANSTGTAWGSSYNSTPGSQIPSNFIPILNQSTTGNAATASSLDHSPPQCAAGNFSIGITATGSANCQPSGGGNAQVVIATGTTPLTIKTPDLATNITFTMANGTTPSITSSTGAINFSDLIISDLAGTGTAILQADSSGNVSRSTYSSVIPYPPAPAGIAVTDGTQWLANYNSSNPIPSSYIPILNQPTTGNAGTATALATTPAQCTTGQFATGIAASGNANCAAPSVTSVNLNAISPATGFNAINNGPWSQTWNWKLTGTATTAAYILTESGASTNTGNSSLVAIKTVTGSTIGPLLATANGGTAGVAVTPGGDIQAQGTATFIGPHRLPGIISAGSLATDSSGNVVVGSAGGMTWPTSTGIAVYNGSSAWTTSYSSSNPIPANYVSSIPYSQLTGTVPTWNQSTTGNAATATNISTNGLANQRWGMDATGTTQGWQTPTSGFTAGGDLSGTSTSQQVVGIQGTAVPTPATGWLHFVTGTGFTWDSPLPTTATQGSVLVANPANTWVACPPGTNLTVMTWLTTGCPGTGGLTLNATGTIAGSSASTNTTLISGQNGNANGTVGILTLQGGDNTGVGSSGTNAGKVIIRGGNNAGTNAASVAGHIGVYGGGSTGATGTGHQGFRQSGQWFLKGATVTQWNLQQITTVAETTADAVATPPWVIGVAQSVGSTSVLVVSDGEVPVNSTNSAVVGHTVCAGATAGKVTDSGGTAICSSGFTFGVVNRITGTYTLSDGTSAPLSATLPSVIILSLR